MRRSSSTLPALRVASTTGPVTAWSGRPRASAQRLGERTGLQRGQPGDAAEREVEQRVELGAAERRALGGALHLDELAVAGRHDVQVGAGRDVLGVVEVQDRVPSTMPTLIAATLRHHRLRSAEEAQASASAR
jgi:hypothetical protein